MATVVPVSSLNDTLHGIKLHVRVIRVWQGKGNNAIVNFVVLDNQRGAIQGKVRPNDYRKFRQHLAVGKLCEIGKFTVAPAGNGYRAVSNDFALWLRRESTVYPLSTITPDIPLRYFEPRDLEDVGSLLTSDTDIIDVVARIVGFSPIQIVKGYSGMVRVATLFLGNERDFVMDVALWEEFIDKFDIPALIAQSASSPVVIACNSLQLRKFQDRWCLKTFAGSLFHFDHALSEAATLLASLPPQLPPIFNDEVASSALMSTFAVLPVARRQIRRMALAELSSYDAPSKSVCILAAHYHLPRSTMLMDSFIIYPFPLLMLQVYNRRM